MGWAFGKHEGQKKYIRGLVGKLEKKETTWKP
jgi:hypothetical protein